VEADLNRTNDSLTENNIILVTVLNAVYPITVEILAKICKGSNKDNLVDRIVIFSNSGRGDSRQCFAQALVEFRTIESACMAKKNMHGCDIYSDVCTLKVEFARQEKLIVKRNDERSWDFTQNLGDASNGKIENGQVARRKVLLSDKPSVPKEEVTNIYGRNDTPESQAAIGTGLLSNNYIGNGEMNRWMDGTGYQPYPAQDRSPVIIVYSLDPESFNCQRAFNLFCLYGNVEKINFLKSKEGCAMVEFSDYAAVESACRNLGQVRIFGARIRLEPSKKTHVEEIRQPHDLPDGTESYKNFYRDRNNRFDTPERAAKNRIIPPTKTLHFYNVPLMSEEALLDIFTDNLAPCPARINWFEDKSESPNKTGRGLVEFDTVEESCEALVICNNLPVKQEDDQDRTYNIKLCFSRTPNN